MTKMLTTAQLAERWAVSPSTLVYQRQVRKGCPYVKLPNGSVRYRQEDVNRIEEEGLVVTR